LRHRRTDETDDGDACRTVTAGAWRDLLCARDERPRRRAAEKRDELAALHVGHPTSSRLARRQSVYRTLSLPQSARQSPWGRPEMF